MMGLGIQFFTVYCLPYYLSHFSDEYEICSIFCVLFGLPSLRFISCSIPRRLDIKPWTLVFNFYLFIFNFVAISVLELYCIFGWVEHVLLVLCCEVIFCQFHELKCRIQKIKNGHHVIDCTRSAFENFDMADQAIKQSFIYMFLWWVRVHLEVSSW